VCRASAQVCQRCVLRLLHVREPDAYRSVPPPRDALLDRLASAHTAEAGPGPMVMATSPSTLAPPPSATAVTVSPAPSAAPATLAPTTSPSAQADGAGGAPARDDTPKSCVACLGVLMVGEDGSGSLVEAVVAGLQEAGHVPQRYIHTHTQTCRD